VEGWGFVASEGFEPPKAEPADLQLSDAVLPKKPDEHYTPVFYWSNAIIRTVPLASVSVR
jgi:hypothetical protein